MKRVYTIVCHCVIMCSRYWKCLHTFLPEDARVPGQHGLQQQWCISLWLIATQVVLQLSESMHKCK